MEKIYCTIIAERSAARPVGCSHKNKNKRLNKLLNKRPNKWLYRKENKTLKWRRIEWLGWTGLGLAWPGLQFNCSSKIFVSIARLLSLPSARHSPLSFHSNPFSHETASNNQVEGVRVNAKKKRRKKDEKSKAIKRKEFGRVFEACQVVELSCGEARRSEATPAVQRPWLPSPLHKVASGLTQCPTQWQVDPT